MNKKKRFDWYGVIRVTASILISLVIAAVTLVMSALFSKMLTARIAALLRAIRIVGEGEYGHRLQPVGRDEMAQLAGEFTQLTDRLQTTEEVRRRFDVTRDAEITCEANPESVDLKFLKTVRAVQIRRLVHIGRNPVDARGKQDNVIAHIYPKGVNNQGYHNHLGISQPIYRRKPDAVQHHIQKSRGSRKNGSGKHHGSSYHRRNAGQEEYHAEKASYLVGLKVADKLSHQKGQGNVQENCGKHKDQCIFHSQPEVRIHK